MQHPQRTDSHDTLRKVSLQRLFPLLWLAFVWWLLPMQETQAQTGTILRLIEFDASGFPQIRIQFFAADEALSPISDLSSLELIEDGTLIDTYQIERVPLGVELYVVIDGNFSLLETDRGSELSRRELVRNSIVRYVTEFMESGARDGIHILAPVERQAAFLARNATSPTQATEAINAYQPESLPDLAPLAEMIDMALDQAASEESGARHQAMLIFTDGGTLDNLLNSGEITNRANALSMPIYAAIVGSVADDTEVANVRRLTRPTRGFHVHMLTPLDTDPIYTAVQAHATQPQLTYRSQISQNGDYTVTVRLDQAIITNTFNVRVQQPEVILLTDEQVPIQRFGETHITPLEELDPTQTTIRARVRWRDRYPRRLAEVQLLVDNQVVTPLNTPVLDSNDELEIEWAIAGLRPGSYQVAVRVIDELGLSATSQPAQMTIQLLRPTPIPSTPTPVPTPVTAEALPSQPLPLPWISLVVLAAFLLTSGIYLMYQNWRRSQAIVIPPGLTGHGPDEDELSLTGLLDVPPETAPESESSAYLERLGTETGARRFPIPSKGATIGRDKDVADIVFINPSVSRLHASIQQREGSFWLYDEGSASGTYLNFERVGLTPRQLKDRDEVHIGRVHFRFRQEPNQE